MNEVIKIVPCSLENQKPTEIFDCSLEISDTFLEYKIHFLATEPKDENDKSLGDIENVVNHFHCLALKKNIAGIELSIAAKGKRWLVVIMVTGFGADIKIYYRTKEPAVQLYDKLKTWLLND